MIHTFAGEPGGYLGWTVSELTDVDGDGVTDLIAGEPDAAGAAGRTWVWSGRTGGVLHRFDGAPGDNRGYAIADAGDTDGDGIDDVITGAPGADPAAGPGGAALRSGADGEELRSFTGASANTGLAPGREAGDLGRRRPRRAGDRLLPSSAGAPFAGRVELFTATGDVLRTITSTTAGENLGFDVVGVGDVDADGIGDLLVSAAEGRHGVRDRRLGACTDRLRRHEEHGGQPVQAHQLDQPAHVRLRVAQPERAAVRAQPLRQHGEVDHQRGIREAQLRHVDDHVAGRPQGGRDGTSTASARRAVLFPSDPEDPELFVERDDGREARQIPG